MADLLTAIQLACLGLIVRGAMANAVLRRLCICSRRARHKLLKRSRNARQLHCVFCIAVSCERLA